MTFTKYKGFTNSETWKVNDIIENTKDYKDMFEEEKLMCIEITTTKLEAIKILTEIIRDYFIDSDILNKVNYRDVNWKEVAEKRFN